MRVGRTLLMSVFVTAVVLSQGCGLEILLVGAGVASTVAYVRGDLEAVESAKLEVVYDATLKALDKLELKVTRKSKDVLSGLIIARDTQDKKITIKFKSVSEEATKLSIRVGVFGSETKSRLLYQEIRENLRRKTDSTSLDRVP